MIKVKVEVLPMNVDELARANVRGAEPVALESGGRSDYTFELKDDQEIVISGKMIGRVVLNRDQRATQLEYHKGETPAPQSAYDPEKDPAVQKQREEEKARREGRRSPSAFVDPNAKRMDEVFTGSEKPLGEQREASAVQGQPTETELAARRIREEQQKTATTGASPSPAGTEPSKQTTVPAQPVSPASRPVTAESKVGGTEPVAASALGGAASSKDVKDDGAKSKT